MRTDYKKKDIIGYINLLQSLKTKHYFIAIYIKDNERKHAIIDIDNIVIKNDYLYDKNEEEKIKYNSIIKLSSIVKLDKVN